MASTGDFFEMQSAAGIVPLSQVTPAGESGRAGGAFSLLFVAPQRSDFRAAQAGICAA